MALTCPKCAEAMEPVSFEGTTIDRCRGCGGIWFDAFEREALLDAAGGGAVDVGDSRRGREMNAIDKIPCPHCSGRMVRMVDAERSDVRFEQCASCGGSFLDAGELRELRRVTVGKLLRRVLSL